MSVFLNFIILILALAIFAPILVFSFEVLFSIIPGPTSGPTVISRPRIAVLMPAHNESLGIRAALASIIPQLSEGDRMIVIADNCFDDTADVARAAGATVAIRDDPSRRGKGYALDFGVRQLEGDPPDVVIVLDADCDTDPRCVDTLAQWCREWGRPVQATYLMLNPVGATLKMRVAEFAFLIKNMVRPTGLRRLGLPCQLMGTGMAFPWSLISAAPLATGHIVEDLKLGIDLAMQGKPPIFCEEALVTSRFSPIMEATSSQRTRWEHGHIGVILSEAPGLFRSAIRRMDVNLLAMAFDLSVPPLALLALAQSIVWLAGVVLFVLGGNPSALLVSTASATMLIGFVVLSWARFGRRLMSFRDLAFTILYSLSKIPLYVRFVVSRQIDWVRTKRDE